MKACWPSIGQACDTIIVVDRFVLALGRAHLLIFVLLTLVVELDGIGCIVIYRMHWCILIQHGGQGSGDGIA